LRTDCRCETAWTPSATHNNNADTHLVESPSQTFAAITSEPKIQLAVLDAESLGSNLALEVATDCLKHGRHVMLGFQAFQNQPNQFASLRHLAESLGRQIFIPLLHRWESPYLGLRTFLDKRLLGQLRGIRRISRQFVPPALVGNRNLSCTFQQSIDRLWFQMLDELLTLAPESDPVIETTQEFLSKRVVTESDTSSRRVTGRRVDVNFGSLESEQTVLAQVELCRDSFVPLETGWILEGTEGGYFDRKWYRSTPQFELVDVPVEFPQSNQDGFYDAVVTSIRHGTPFPIPLDSVQRVLNLWQSIEGFQLS
jgi:hypothetical protein